jgi:hypothetical protein
VIDSRLKTLAWRETAGPAFASRRERRAERHHKGHPGHEEKHQRIFTHAWFCFSFVPFVAFVVVVAGPLVLLAKARG